MACGWFMRDLGGVEALVLSSKRCRVCRSRVILVCFLATAVANDAERLQACGALSPHRAAVSMTLFACLMIR